MKKRHLGTSAILGAAACLAIGLHIFSSPALAQDPRAGFIFLGAWFGDPDTDGDPDVLVMNGSGSFNSASAQGEGSFTHFEIAGGGLPPIRAFGTWKAGRVISWQPIGVWGAYAAGILVMEVTLHPTGEAPIAGTLKIVCNIPPGGLINGAELEAITLTLPGGVTFGPANAGSTTTFPLAVEQRR